LKAKTGGISVIESVTTILNQIPQSHTEGPDAFQSFAPKGSFDECAMSGKLLRLQADCANQYEGDIGGRFGNAMEMTARAHCHDKRRSIVTDIPTKRPRQPKH
jgi:hypothetical protein